MCDYPTHEFPLPDTQKFSRRAGREERREEGRRRRRRGAVGSRGCGRRWCRPHGVRFRRENRPDAPFPARRTARHPARRLQKSWDGGEVGPDTLRRVLLGPLLPVASRKAARRRVPVEISSPTPLRRQPDACKTPGTASGGDNAACTPRRVLFLDAVGLYGIRTTYTEVQVGQKLTSPSPPGTPTRDTDGGVDGGGVLSE